MGSALSATLLKDMSNINIAIVSLSRDRIFEMLETSVFGRHPEQEEFFFCLEKVVVCRFCIRKKNQEEESL